MLYLFLTVLLSVLLLVCFRFFAKWHINTFQTIVFNYLTCVVVGAYFFGLDYELPLNPLLITGDWLPIAMLTGTMFISTFYLISQTTLQFGISTASVATKISMAIPIAFNLIVFQTSHAEYDMWNYAGMLLSFAAVIFCTLPTRQENTNTQSSKNWLLPSFIFLMSGLIDTVINYASLHCLLPQDEMPFSIFAFGTAATIGFLVMAGYLLFGGKFDFKSIVAGVVLGIPNYFSLYYLIKTLAYFKSDGAFVFPLLNVGIIVVGAIAGLLLFKEKMNVLNYIGLAMAIGSIFLISYQAFL